MRAVTLVTVIILTTDSNINVSKTPFCVNVKNIKFHYIYFVDIFQLKWIGLNVWLRYNCSASELSTVQADLCYTYFISAYGKNCCP